MNIIIFISMFSFIHAFLYANNKRSKIKIFNQFANDLYENNFNNTNSQMYYKPNYIDENTIYSITGIEPWNYIQD